VGSIFNRGTRDAPAWYVKFKNADGAWKMRRSKQVTEANAKKFVGEVEGARAARAPRSARPRTGFRRARSATT
jgi:hypothetical protein